MRIQSDVSRLRRTHRTQRAQQGAGGNTIGVSPRGPRDAWVRVEAASGEECARRASRARTPARCLPTTSPGPRARGRDECREREEALFRRKGEPTHQSIAVSSAIVEEERSRECEASCATSGGRGERGEGVTRANEAELGCGARGTQASACKCDSELPRIAKHNRAESAHPSPFASSLSHSSGSPVTPSRSGASPRPEP